MFLCVCTRREAGHAESRQQPRSHERSTARPGQPLAALSSPPPPPQRPSPLTHLISPPRCRKQDRRNTRTVVTRAPGGRTIAVRALVDPQRRRGRLPRPTGARKDGRQLVLRRHLGEVGVGLRWGRRLRGGGGRGAKAGGCRGGARVAAKPATRGPSTAGHPSPVAAGRQVHARRRRVAHPWRRAAGRQRPRSGTGKCKAGRPGRGGARRRPPRLRQWSVRRRGSGHARGGASRVARRVPVRRCVGRGGVTLGRVGCR